MAKTLQFIPDLHLSYVGPHLNEGALPALFYFAVSQEDSLCLYPFNQPVAHLAALPMRIFSMTLPGHGPTLPVNEALKIWATEIAQGRNIIAEFVEKITLAVETLIHQGVLLQDRLAVAGLSRGAFIATHAAAKISHFRYLLGFAPLSSLAFAKEFSQIKDQPLTTSLDLRLLVDSLTDRQVRFYIGNVDTRVDTRLCFNFIEALAKRAADKQITSPQVELYITPSIGPLGHGTSKETFQLGAAWIAEKLGVNKPLAQEV